MCAVLGRSTPWCFIAAALTIIHAECSRIDRRHLRHSTEPSVPGHLARAPSPESAQCSFVHSDPDPLEINMTFVTQLNPKDGNPWYRYKKVADGGSADHPHFGSLTSTGVFKDDISMGHNVVRRRAGLQELKWSDELEKLASNRVQKLVNGGCYIRHSSVDYRWAVAGFAYVGENLYKVINMAPTGVDISDAWYAEIDDYTYGRVGQPCVKTKCASRSSPPCAMGHFTQLMWADTTHLGCARAECPNERQRTFVSVCHYGPGGNIVGSAPFNDRVADKLEFGHQLCAPGNHSFLDGKHNQTTLALGSIAAHEVRGFGPCAAENMSTVF